MSYTSQTFSTFYKALKEYSGLNTY